MSVEIYILMFNFGSNVDQRRVVCLCALWPILAALFNNTLSSAVRVCSLLLRLSFLFLQSCGGRECIICVCVFFNKINTALILLLLVFPSFQLVCDGCYVLWLCTLCIKRNGVFCFVLSESEHQIIMFICSLLRLFMRTWRIYRIT